jgi:hypothetical protein
VPAEPRPARWRGWRDVSYNRTDLSRIAQSCCTSNSALLLFMSLFMSQAAVDSKYVRREVRFADSVDKPIISVQLEATRLRHGMGLLLTHYQMLNPSAQDFLAQLDRALKTLS